MCVEKMVEILNQAFEMDPVAIRSLLCFQVPVNEQIADHPTIIVRECETGWAMTFLGLLNGLMDEKICTKWSDEPMENGEHKFLGFGVL